MITIEKIILWELLRKKSFAEFDTKNSDDDLAILYVADEAAEKERVTFGMYKEALAGTAEGDIRKRLKDINREIIFSSQFFLTGKETDEKDGKEKVQKVGDLIGRMICLGINPTGIMNLPLRLLSYITGAYAEYIRQTYEDKRFWGMLQLSPWLSKGTTPHEFLPLPWDDESEKEKEEEKVTKEDIQVAEFLFRKNKKVNDNGKA